MTRRQLTAFALAGFTVLAVAWLARGSDGSGPPGKSGGAAGVVLRLGVVEYPGTPAAQIAERFSQRVKQLSNESIRVKITYWPTRFERTTTSDQVEASAIRAIRAGELQLGLIPSHAFEAQGVTSFRALQAPFLITSLPQAARVTAGRLADQLQVGLSGIAVTGLGLVPEGLYRPFGFLKPLTSPADFADLRILADSSGATRAVLRTLGARPIDLNVGGGDTLVYSGFGNEATSLRSASDDFPKDAFTAGNIALFPKIDVIIASTGALARLRPAQRAVLRRAATETRATSIGAAEEGVAAAAFCREGGTIVLAAPADVQQLRTKVARLLDAMRRAPATGALVRRIEQLAPGGRSGVPPCTPSRAEPVVEPSYDAPPSVVKSLAPATGSYRRAFTSSELRAAGANETEARRNEGVTTLTFYGLLRHPLFVLEWQDPTRLPCRGRVDFPNRLVELRWNPGAPCSGYAAFSWKPGARGDLAIGELDPRSEPAWIRNAYPGTWKRVDCTPSCGARAKLSAGETRRLLERGLPAKMYVACHQVASFAWDYECSYRADFRRIGPYFGVDVDDRGITRRSDG